MTGDITLGNLIRMASNNSIAYKQSGGTVTGAAITSGTINNAVIGGTTPAAGTFTTAQASTGKFITGIALPAVAYTSAAESGTFAAGNLTNANSPVVVFQSITSTPGTVTTRTAALMIADMTGFVGQVYLLRVLHTGSGTLTIAAGSNVTINGTATVSTATWRDFQVSISGATAMTFQNCGSGTA
jgi:hypothetical protein